MDHISTTWDCRFFQSVADPTLVTGSRNLPFPQTAEAVCPPLRHAQLEVWGLQVPYPALIKI